MKQIIAVCALPLVLFLLAGCAGMMNKNKDTVAQPLLEPQAVARFNDVPVPSGFKPITKESYSFESAGMRVGLLKFQGKANTDQVVNFYKEQMAMYNWNLLNVVEYGECLLNFDRESESCVITLLTRGNSVTIVISIGPKAHAAPKRATVPLK